MPPHRRRFRVSCCLAVIAVAAVAATSFVTAAGASAPAGGRDEEEPEPVAVLDVVRDEVEVKLDGEDDFEPAEDGQDLHEGDTVRTDEDGRATIEYEDDSYTRLDVDTTFKIVSLTDDEGNRKVEGSLDVGRAWNRTEELTESESFEMSGAGATAAVVGTAFAQECPTSDRCIWTAVEHFIVVTAEDGTPQLIPLDQVTVVQGLIGQIVHLTLAQIAAMDWIQQNLYLDLLAGFGNGPFVVPTGGTTTAATTTAGTPSGTPPAGTTETPPPPPPPPSVPGAPTITSIVVGDGQATVSFTEPPDGGSPITQYTAIGSLVSTTGFSTTAFGDVSASGPGSPIVVPGLFNGQGYVFQVTATNAVGTSPTSATSNIVIPVGPPGAPADAVATAGNEQASVSFTPPDSDGGGSITSYTVTAPGGQTAPGADSPIVVTGLTNGTSYTFTVTATNEAGTGPPSDPSNAVVPGPPGVPTGVSASLEYSDYSEQVSVSFTPTDNGAADTASFKVYANGSYVASGTSSPIVVSDLDEGTYTFTVSAVNVNGESAQSAPSNSVHICGYSTFAFSSSWFSPAATTRSSTARIEAPPTTPEPNEPAPPEEPTPPVEEPSTPPVEPGDPPVVDPPSTEPPPPPEESVPPVTEPGPPRVEELFV